MLNIKKAAIFLIKVLLHFVAIAIIVYAFWPVADWYMKSRPIWGVDYFLQTSLANLVKSHLVAPYALWDYSWFSGMPIFTYPILHSYIVALLAGHFDIVYAVGIWMMVSTAIFVLGSYFLFFAISGNLVLAAILAIATAYSAGVYQTLTWAGSTPSYATQAAFPWVLALLVWYLKSDNWRFLLAAGLVGGISVWGHPLVFIIYIIPASLILIVTRFSKGLAIFWKIKITAVFLIISVLIAFPIFYTTFKASLKNVLRPSYSQGALSTTTSTPSELERGIAEFNRAQVKRAIDDNNFAPFILLGLTAAMFLVGLAVGRRIVSVFEVLPYFLIAAYFSFYIWLFGQGISIFHGGWYRLFWSVPIWIGMLASVLWREAITSVYVRVKSKSLRAVLLTGYTLAVLVMGVGFLIAEPANEAIAKIIYRSQESSAYPEILNTRVTDLQREDFKSDLVPGWLDADDTNWRLYDPDQTVNLWWSSLYKMPLARGYLDPNDNQKGYVFLLDSALSEADGEPQLVKVFGYPLETVVSNALFMIDWNAVRYFEGGHTSMVSNTPVPKYLEDFILREETIDLDYLKFLARHRTMRFFEFKSDFVSPILSATNASTLGIFATDSGFETVVRAIAEKDNLNSQRLIPINLGRSIDKYSLSDLKNFDSLYLYDYDYKKENKAFKTLEEYVRGGKKIFIDTGVEVKQSSGDLSDFFPVKRVERKGLGKSWNFEVGLHPLVKDVDFAKFSEPVFDDSEWKMSYAEVSDVRGGASVILKNHGNVVLAGHKLGEGEVIWSGLNFAYHVSRNHNTDEAKLFVNILSDIVDLDRKPLPNSKIDFKNANNRTISEEGARGILFKEMAHDGWSAHLVGGGGGKLKIFKAGPAYPGYMYIPLSEGKNVVNFRFGGSLQDKLLTWISLLVILFVLDEVIIGGLIFGRLRRFIHLRFKRKVSGWWEREEE